MTFSLTIDNYMENAKLLHNQLPYFYDKSGIFWMWDIAKHCYVQVDDIDVMRMFDEILGFRGQTVTTKIKSNTLEAMKRYGRTKIPLMAKTKWVQFKDKAYSIHSGKIHKVTPKYFFTNPIPWELGESDATPILDQLFKEWVGEEHIIDLYEIIAYCCYRAYPIQTLFCLFGSGRNGKSTFSNIVTKFIGENNICSTDLDLITGHGKSRFEVFKLYKKLVCTMGETNFGSLDSSSLIKRLTGGDRIGFEKKGKDPFDDYTYAKILISSNSLPSSNDTSEGFYRRWHIIDFSHEFPEGKDILGLIPDCEFSNLALKSMGVLKALLFRGSFTNQGSIPDRVRRYTMASNPLSIFLETYGVKGDSEYVQYSELYTAYITFLRKGKRRRVRMKEFRSALEDEGLWVTRTTKSTGQINNEGYPIQVAGNWVEGLSLVSDWKEKIAKNAFFHKNSNSPLSDRGSTEIDAFLHKSHKFKKEEIVHAKCTHEGCEIKICNFDEYGVPYCEQHMEERRR